MKIEEVRQGTIMVLKPCEALIEEGLDEFCRVLDDQLSAGNTRLVLDFEEMPFVDSRGLEALLDAAERAERWGGGIRIASPCDISRDILVATRLANRIQVFDDVSEARKSFL